MSDGRDHRLIGDNLLTNFWTNGTVNDLEESVSHYRAALKAAGEGSEDRLRAEISLSNGLRIQCEEGLAGEEQFRESQELAERAVKGAAVPSQLHQEALISLAETLSRRGRSLDQETSHRSIATLQQVEDEIGDVRSPLLVTALSVRASALSRRFALFGDKEALTIAGSVVDRALQLAQEIGSSPPELASAVADVRARSFMVTEQWDDIRQATATIQQLISSLPMSHPRLHQHYTWLGFCFVLQYQYGGDKDDLDRTVAAFSEAAQRVPNYHPNWHVAHGNYASALHDRFRARSNLEDLDQAISLIRKVVQHINDPSLAEKPVYGDAYVGNLGQFLEESYAQYGRLELLDEAITLHLQNLEVTPAVRQNFVLEDVGRSYMSRYTAHGRLSDLESAISYFRKALSSAVVDREQALSTFVLAEALLAMHVEQEDTLYLEDAVSLLRQNTSYSDPLIRARSYSLLGYALLCRFMSTGITADVKESIQCQRHTLEFLPAGHIVQPHAYSRLGLAEYQMALKEHDVSAAHASVSAFNSALSGLSDRHPDRAAYLRHRATTELLLSAMEGPEYFEDALKSFREASSHEESWVTDRYTAATEWARVTHASQRLEEGIEAYRMAIGLLPRLAWVGLEEALRMQRLARLAPDLAQDAAACAISLGNYKLAVELSEAARSVLWNASQELRTDLSRLKEEAPELAAELAETSAALEYRPSIGMNQDPEESKTMTEVQRVRTHRLASRRAELVSLIRARPGFERFLLRPSYEDLSQVTRDGPVVIVNSSTYRCDALMLHRDHAVSVVPLSSLSHIQVLEEARVLQTCLQLAKDSRGLKFLELKLIGLLRRLWTSVGEPVCQLIFDNVGPTDVRRIWWCPTGPMSFLPLHACGPHDGRHADMSDLLISSYTPTLSALLRARKSKSPMKSKALTRMLVICQPEVPGRKPLPCAVDELQAIKNIFRSTATALVGPQGTISRVEELLPTHSWLHVSTHGTQDHQSPLDSSLALHDGPLKLGSLAHLRLPRAECAFLSACHSAKGTYWIPNESMHLAGGLMFAGYKSVVATMWAIADKDVPKVVEAFYEHLVRNGGPPMGIETAEALHVSIQALRESGVPAFRWVPYIHLGA